MFNFIKNIFKDSYRESLNDSEKSSWDHIQSLDFPDKEFHEKAFKHFKKVRDNKK